MAEGFGSDSDSKWLVQSNEGIKEQRKKVKELRQEYSRKETADLLGISESSVKRADSYNKKYEKPQVPMKQLELVPEAPKSEQDQISVEPVIETLTPIINEQQDETPVESKNESPGHEPVIARVVSIDPKDNTFWRVYNEEEARRKELEEPRICFESLVMLLVKTGEFTRDDAHAKIYEMIKAKTMTPEELSFFIVRRNPN